MTGVTTTKTYQFDNLPLIGLTVSESGKTSIMYHGKDDAIDDWAKEELERIQNGNPTTFCL